MLAPNPFGDRTGPRNPTLNWLQRQLAWEQRLTQLRHRTQRQPSVGAIEERADQPRHAA